MSVSINLLDDLWLLANAWVEATGTNHSTLGNRVIFNSGVFNRLKADRGITLGNFERLLGYLLSDTNWPNELPVRFAPLLLKYAAVEASSPDTSRENIVVAA